MITNDNKPMVVFAQSKGSDKVDLQTNFKEKNQNQANKQINNDFTSKQKPTVK